MLTLFTALSFSIVYYVHILFYVTSAHSRVILILEKVEITVIIANLT